jgi:pimeloyl-ACP methyl ester carboxylesterase
MATLSVADHTIGYAVEGDGAPLLLLHGTTMNRTAWDMVRAAMPADAAFRYVMVEFPGSGESSMPDAPLTVEGLADQAAAVMAHLGHDRYHVAGYSLGAVVAAAVAARHADRVQTATLLCGWIAADARMRFTFDLWKRLIDAGPELFMRYAVADGFTAEAIGGLEPMLDAVVGMGAGALAPGSHAHLDLDIALDITSLLPAVTAPTLVIGGEQDRWADVRHSHALAAAIAGARLEVLPAGHLVIQELAADVARLLHTHAGG